MRYISLFSGLGGAELAFAPLGWECVAVSEIDPAACAVLAHHYPTVLNLGDINAVNGEDYKGKVDLMIGGCPCQSFSVAGLRKSLGDARGNLTMKYVELTHAIDPTWTVFENVPGILSTSDNAFGCFLGGMVGADTELIPARGQRWTDSGVVTGPLRTAAWRILDAQYLGVAQRRRRVFVLSVRGSRNWSCAAALFPFSKSMCGNYPPRREKGQRVAGTIKGGSGERGWPDPSDGNGGGLVDVAGTLGGGSGERGWQHHDGAGAIAHTLGTRNTKGTDERGDGSSNLQPVWPADVASTLDAHFGDKWGLEDQHINSGASHFVPVAEPMCIKGAAIGRKPEAGPQYGEVLTDGSSYTLNASETHGVFAFTQNSRDEVRVIGDDGEVSGSLSAEPGTHQTTYLAYRTNAAGQVDPQGDLSAALTSNTDPCTQILAFDTTQVTSKTNRSNPQVGDPCHTLAKGAEPPSIAYRIHGENSTAMTGDGIARVADPVDVARSLDTCGGYATNQGGNVVKQSMQVRRLTPVECCRLQGIPDDHLTVLYNGKPLADGPKYRLCGNSFAIPCVAWIGKRIQMVEDLLK
jgi:DNA (cytosine-5)-methyltransferase 1